MRATFIWMSMIFVTSIDQISMITKRNFVCAAIPLCFLAMMDDICNLQLLTEEPGEHAFGSFRSMNREFTVMNMIHLVEKMRRRMAAIYRGDLQTCRNPKKGYQASFSDFIRMTRAEDTSNYGTVPVSYTGFGCFAQQIWDDGRLLKNNYGSQLADEGTACWLVQSGEYKTLSIPR
jgi:hypothetical protein